MHMKKRLLIIPAAVLLAGASGVRFVHAASGPTPSSITASAQTDNNGGNVQQGDQTSLDVAGAANATDAPEANASEAATGAESTAPDGDNVQQGDQTGTDTGN